MSSITVRKALRDALAEEMRLNNNVVLLGEEVGEYQGAYKVTEGLLQEFGANRVIDTPITEHGFAGMGVGMAFGGLNPIVEFMTFNFAMQAIDHIINSAAKTSYMSGGTMKCPIVFRGPNGSAAGVAAQHSQCYASWYAHCPGIKVIAPFEASHSKALLKAAIKDPSPVVFLEHELAYGMKFDINSDFDLPLEIGKALVTKTGTDVTIVGFSWIMSKVYEAEKILAEKGIAVEIIDLLTIRPLDIGTIVKSVKTTNRLVVVEEGWGFSGIGAEISALINEKAFDYLDCNVKRVFAADVPLPYAKNLEQVAIPSTKQIVNAVLESLYLPLLQ
ncbi:MAG: pyruvate dehydrogenase complex E1 component subunit beta [Alphaproteobacteria bacterium]|nr:pyruvate dehydrogenase complex E1 component subunit beta [Rickettsiales bacterium]